MSNTALAKKWPGAFISFEGGDGAGKSTQIKLLAEALREAGHEVVVTREPGGSEGAEAIRTLLVEGDADRWSPVTEALLMYASRADHLEKTILPALARGAIVISDRFADSTMAYQGYAGELGQERVKQLHALVVGDSQPDLTIILDTPVEEGLKRAGDRGGEARFESKGTAYQEAVRHGFLAIAKADPDRCAVVDARGSIEEVAEKVRAVVRKQLGRVVG